MENAESYGNDGLLFAVAGGPTPSPLSNSLEKEFSADEYYGVSTEPTTYHSEKIVTWIWILSWWKCRQSESGREKKQIRSD